ncbi:MAG: glycine zipper 2TM domain-containing protein [Rubrivivax sp.]|nr:glycine zipper 2TM domain-containing protein [Rubrivivax sp.]
MEVSTLAPVARRPHPAMWFAGALAFVVLGAAGAVGYMKWRPAERAQAAAAMPAPESHAAAPGAGSGSATPPPPLHAPPQTAPQTPPQTALATQPAAAAPACATCGVVEAVTPVQRKGEGTGVGAVVGGVLGGVVGHQMGGGRGKDAMTVIGAVGGGVAGHEVEKRARATTVYQVKVRLADGSTRTVTQANPVPVGEPVQLQGGRATPLPRQGAPAPAAARTQPVSTRG